MYQSFLVFIFFVLFSIQNLVSQVLFIHLYRYSSFLLILTASIGAILDESIPDVKIAHRSPLTLPQMGELQHFSQGRMTLILYDNSQRRLSILAVNNLCCSLIQSEEIIFMKRGNASHYQSAMNSHSDPRM